VSTAEHDPSHRVRASVATTKAEGTARIRYAAHFVDGLPSLINALGKEHPAAATALKAVGSAMRRAVAPIALSTLPGPDGQIDFDNERSVYSRGKFWKLYAPGREYIGQPGEWETERELDALTDEDPFWLLAVLAATVQATAHGDVMVLRTNCERYSGFADLQMAHTGSSQPIAPPFHADELDLSRLPIEVWLDTSGRIRQAILRGPGEHQTQLELSGFGQADRIALPKDDEVLPDEA
jgi:hypothetical protein